MRMVNSDHWLDRDGWATRFLEKIPVVGFMVAGGHLIAGNEVRDPCERVHSQIGTHFR